MSRRINDDFLLLEDFITNYQLSKYNSDPEQIEKYKSMHKKLYAFLVFVAEFERQSINKNSDKFLSEVSSDLMLSLFCAIQGMYKPAKLQLRCGIENFIKAIIMIDTPQIVVETSVYAIFDAATKDKHFATVTGDKVRQKIRNAYTILCHTVHGDTSVMHPLSALSLLPEYDEKFLAEFANIYIGCVEHYLEIFYLNYPMVLDNMHPYNKQDVLDAMSKKTKSEVIHELYEK